MSEAIKPPKITAVRLRALSTINAGTVSGEAMRDAAEEIERLRGVISDETNRAQDAVMRGLVMAEALKFYAEHAGEYAHVAIDALAEASK